MTKGRYRALAAAVAGCIAAAICFAQPDKLSKDRGRVTQKIKNFSLPHHEGGKLEWEVTGKLAYFYQNKEVDLEEPRLVVSPKDDKPGYEITAKRGTIEDNKENFNT